MKSLEHSSEQAGFIQLEEKMLKEGFNTRLRLPWGFRDDESDSFLWETTKGQEATGITCSKGNSDKISGKTAHMVPPRGGSALATGSQSS